MDSVRCIGAIRTQALASNNYFLDPDTDRQVAGCCSGWPCTGGNALRNLHVGIGADPAIHEVLRDGYPNSLCQSEHLFERSTSGGHASQHPSEFDLDHAWYFFPAIFVETDFPPRMVGRNRVRLDVDRDWQSAISR